MARRDNDPLLSFNFTVETGGVLQAYFNECTGLNAEVQPVEYRNGNEAPTMRKIPGLIKYGNVTLKRGLTESPDFIEWIQKAIDGDVQRIELSIIITDDLKEEKIRYNLQGAWPSKFVGPDLKAGDNSVAMESLELVYEGVRKG
jgi:phage tail-like protein